jgi:hypothetical protein
MRQTRTQIVVALLGIAGWLVVGTRLSAQFPTDPRLAVTFDQNPVHVGDLVTVTVSVRGLLIGSEPLEIRVTSSDLTCLNPPKRWFLDPPGFVESTTISVNTVAEDGVTISASRLDGGIQPGQATLTVLPPPCEYGAIAPESLQLIVATESVDTALYGLTGETPELFAGMAPTPDPQGPARITAPEGPVTIYASLVSQVLPDRVSGWTFSMPVDETGGARLTDASVVGTAAEGALQGGFVVSEVTSEVGPDPFIGCPTSPTGHGAVCAIVLHLADGMTLQPTGTASVWALTFEGDEGQSVSLEWQDGCVGSGDPVPNTVTIGLASNSVFCRQPAVVSFGPPPNPRFRRGDSNQDGLVDISDSMYTLGFLFLSGPPAECRKAADANDDGAVDLSDAVYGLGFLFLGGPPPPEPSGGCGEDRTEDDLSCDAYDALCG